MPREPKKQKQKVVQSLQFSFCGGEQARRLLLLLLLLLINPRGGD